MISLREKLAGGLGFCFLAMLIELFFDILFLIYICIFISWKTFCKENIISSTGG